MRFVSIAAALVLLLSSGIATAQLNGNAENGRGKAFTCMGCHGSPGLRNAYPGYKVPKLGGQHAAYIAAALAGYQNKDRSHPTMQGHAATMSAQDMADIGAYFASLKP